VINVNNGRLHKLHSYADDIELNEELFNVIERINLLMAQIKNRE